jgi:hypothetical protein
MTNTAFSKKYFYPNLARDAKDAVIKKIMRRWQILR